MKKFLHFVFDLVLVVGLVGTLLFFLVFNKTAETKEWYKNINISFSVPDNASNYDDVYTFLNNLDFNYSSYYLARHSENVTSGSITGVFNYSIAFKPVKDANPQTIPMLSRASKIEFSDDFLYTQNETAVLYKQYFNQEKQVTSGETITIPEPSFVFTQNEETTIYNDSTYFENNANAVAKYMSGQLESKYSFECFTWDGYCASVLSSKFNSSSTTYKMETKDGKIKAYAENTDGTFMYIEAQDSKITQAVISTSDLYSVLTQTNLSPIPKTLNEFKKLK